MAIKQEGKAVKYKNTAEFVPTPKVGTPWRQRARGYNPELAASSGVRTIKPRAPRMVKQPTEGMSSDATGGRKVSDPFHTVSVPKGSQKGRDFSEFKSPRYNKQVTEK